MLSVRTLKHRFYDGVPGWQSGTAQYVALVERNVNATDRVLDIGAGDGQGFAHSLRGRVREFVGLDPAPGVVSNPALDRGVVGVAEKMPLDDESFDACVCSFTLEHVADPARAAREAWRVLRPGGRFVLRTPNLYHYAALIAWLTPHWFHRLVANPVRGLPPDTAEPHPTYYRCNTPRRVRKVFRQAGFTVAELRTIEPEPAYLQFSGLAFLLGTAYERLLNATELLAPLRVTILGVLRKPGGPDR
jgi:ubiquinone/menaquinone biosynthesis C-methylase UbiE